VLRGCNDCQGPVSSSGIAILLSSLVLTFQSCLCCKSTKNSWPRLIVASSSRRRHRRVDFQGADSSASRLQRCQGPVSSCDITILLSSLDCVVNRQRILEPSWLWPVFYKAPSTSRFLGRLLHYTQVATTIHWHRDRALCSCFCCKLTSIHVIATIWFSCRHTADINYTEAMFQWIAL
jgi:hypothetical protein